MFVVRTALSLDSSPVLKAFSDIRRARMYYSAKSIRAFDEQIESVTLFEIKDAVAADAAIAAVEAGSEAVEQLESVTASELRAKREAIEKSADL